MSGNEGMDPDAVSHFIAFTCLRDRLNSAQYRIPPGGPTVSTRRFRPKLYSQFISGSSAEVYIIPMVEYFGDVDMMSCRTDAIAFTDDFPSIPSDVRGFDETIECFKISGTDEILGFCQLVYVGDLSYDWDSEVYKFQASRITSLLSFDREDQLRTFHDADKMLYQAEKALARINTIDSIERIFTSKCTGAALQLIISHRRNTENASKATPTDKTFQKMHHVDFVKCLWCPQWPVAASDWPIRSRGNGWPADVTIQNVVRNGCHVVHAWHPECSENEKAFQKRLSFSYAEVILLRSCSTIQQVVYHMLRFFGKKELIDKNCSKEHEILTGYHLKTIMLWTCENRPKKWWHTAPVVHLLCQLLLDLSSCVKGRNIPNYFIPKANLLRKNLHEEYLTATIKKLDQFSNFASLSQWFLTNYVTPICQKIITEENSIGMSEMITCIAKIDREAVDQNIEMFEENLHFIAESCVRFALMVNKRGIISKIITPEQVTAESILHLVGRDLSWQFGQLNQVLILLYGEYSVSCLGMAFQSEFFTDLIRGIPMESKRVSQKSHNFPPSYRSKLAPSVVLLLRAQEVMEAMTSPTDNAEFQLLARISLMLLKDCVATKDTETESVTCAAGVYMASLYYAVSDYQTASDLSSMITSSRGSTRKTEAKALNAFCFLFIDDIARITGFFLLCEKCVNPCNYNGMQLHLLSLTPHLFAEYLIASSTGSAPKYSNLIRQCNISNIFPLDVLLMFLSKRRHNVDAKTKMLKPRNCVYLRNDVADTAKFRRLTIDESKTTNLLFQWCIDEIVDFADTIADKYFIGIDAAIGYGALLLFKRRQYADVIKACEYILSDTRTPDLPEITHYAKVTIIPPFDGFFDKDIQFLLGLQTLCHFCYSLDADLMFSQQSEDHFRRRSAQNVQSGWALSYKTCPCVRDQYVLSDIFVAKYLLFRITIATREARSKVFAAYRQIESRWHFEKIVHRFLYQQLKHFRFKKV